MRWFVALAATVALAVPALAFSQEDGSKVTMPLDDWEAMVSVIEDHEDPPPPVVQVARIERRIEGIFSKGLFSGTLVERFQVLDEDGHVRVPVIDGDVSLGDVSLDGSRTSLLREADMYTLGVDEPGVYEVRLEFFWGEDRSRFERKLNFDLPQGGITHFSVEIPEVDIDPRLGSGALTEVEARGGSTLLRGNLDSRGVFDLAWTRRVTHKGEQTARMEATVSTLFTVQEAIVTGKTAVEMTLLEGETDVVELDLPQGIEVVRVEGEAVLQWRTDSGGRLRILLRYLVSDRLAVTVHFQSPVESGKPVALLMPLPTGDVPMKGAAGVQGPAGLKIGVAGVESAEELTAYELPPQLAEMTGKPILFGFSFTGPPKLSLSVSRHSQVTLTSTLVEELQASTVIAQDGTEVSKVKIRIRNNTREYIVVDLPEGATLTHAMVDGQPVRPALFDPRDHERLMFPLRQSERVAPDGSRMHTVREGETLSDIANFYYSDPSKWSVILSQNPSTLSSAHSVSAGQVLKIPSVQGVSVEESTFIIELAYKADREALGLTGNRQVSLPGLDVDTMRVTWHLYLPTALDPLDFDANLTQYSSIRYDLFRRMREFIDQVLWVQYAWAGGKYENILAQRKTIYRTENSRKEMGHAIKAAFPLVGEQFRFKRILLGKETPKIEFDYIDRTIAVTARWIGLIAAFAIALLVLSRPRDPKTWIAAVLALVALGVAAHYFLGTHRRIVWGIDLALILSLIRLRAGPAWARMKEIAAEPWRITELVTFGNMAFTIAAVIIASIILAYPLLLSTITLLALGFWWFRGWRAAGKEASDA